MEDGVEDFGYVQRSADVLKMAEKGGKEGGGGGGGEEEFVEEEDEGVDVGGKGESCEGEQNGGSSSVKRKSGELSPPPPEADPATGSSAPATGDAGAREDRSDSGSIGSSKGKSVGRLLRTMSGLKQARDGGKPPPSTAVDPTLSQLPQTFVVKYLGKRDARGLWGIKHTRRPVDSMVLAAKGSDGHPPLVLPLVRLTVSGKGVTLTATSPSGSSAGDKKKKKTPEVTVFHPIDTISYGVQDLVYTRVFSMIIVRESAQVIGAGQNMQHPFQCHGFVCDSRNSARRLTYVLAAAFQEYSKQLKEEEAREAKLGDQDGKTKKFRVFKKFAIDLRTPEQIEEDLKQPESEA